MQRAAETNQELAARVRHLEYRTVEEFYDLRSDPECLENLFDERGERSRVREYAAHSDRLRKILRAWMVDVGDPALVALDQRDRPEALERFMQKYTAKATKEIEALKSYEEQKGYRF